jgi:sugar phosphate isomerase/epimerase
VVDIADKLQTSNIRIFSFYPGAYVSEESFFDQVISRLSKMVEYVQGSDIILMHENEKGIFGHNAENCALLARTMHSKNFRLAYDPGNFVWGEHICNNMDVCWSKMKSWVDHIHIKDWKMNHYDTGCLPGSGDAQIPELIEKLVETKYKGFVTMEPHMDEGGQFGGHTSMDHYRQAITSFRRLAIQKGLNLK